MYVKNILFSFGKFIINRCNSKSYIKNFNFVSHYAHCAKYAYTSTSCKRVLIFRFISYFGLGFLLPLLVLQFVVVATSNDVVAAGDDAWFLCVFTWNRNRKDMLRIFNFIYFSFTCLFRCKSMKLCDFVAFLFIHFTSFLFYFFFCF